jgi:hypothetical protein
MYEITAAMLAVVNLNTRGSCKTVSDSTSCGRMPCTCMHGTATIAALKCTKSTQIIESLFSVHLFSVHNRIEAFREGFLRRSDSLIDNPIPVPSRAIISAPSTHVWYC